MRFNQEIEINATVEEVWKVLINVDRWHEWTPSINGISRIDSSPMGIGCELIVLQPELPESIWTVTSFNPGRNFTWSRGNVLVKVTAEHQLEIQQNKTIANLSIEFKGLLGRMAARQNKTLVENYLTLEAQGLKKRCERQSR